jgi:hypothetical protein
MISAVSHSQRVLDTGAGGKKREIFVRPFWVRCIIIEAWVPIE